MRQWHTGTVETGARIETPDLNFETVFARELQVPDLRLKDIMNQAQATPEQLEMVRHTRHALSRVASLLSRDPYFIDHLDMYGSVDGLLELSYYDLKHALSSAAGGATNEKDRDFLQNNVFTKAGNRSPQQPPPIPISREDVSGGVFARPRPATESGLVEMRVGSTTVGFLHACCRLPYPHPGCWSTANNRTVEGTFQPSDWAYLAGKLWERIEDSLDRQASIANILDMSIMSNKPTYWLPRLYYEQMMAEIESLLTDQVRRAAAALLVQYREELISSVQNGENPLLVKPPTLPENIEKAFAVQRKFNAIQGKAGANVVSDLFDRDHIPTHFTMERYGFVDLGGVQYRFLGPASSINDIDAIERAIRAVKGYDSDRVVLDSARIISRDGLNVVLDQFRRLYEVADQYDFYGEVIPEFKPLEELVKKTGPNIAGRISAMYNTINAELRNAATNRDNSIPIPDDATIVGEAIRLFPETAQFQQLLDAANAKRLAEQQAAANAKRLAEQQAAANAKRLAEQQAAADAKRLAEQQAAAQGIHKGDPQGPFDPYSQDNGAHGQSIVDYIVARRQRKKVQVQSNIGVRIDDMGDQDPYEFLIKLFKFDINRPLHFARVHGPNANKEAIRMAWQHFKNYMRLEEWGDFTEAIRWYRLATEIETLPWTIEPTDVAQLLPVVGSVAIAPRNTKRPFEFRVAEDVYGTQETDFGFQWTANSCWIDSLFMAIFKVPDTPLERRIRGAARINVANLDDQAQCAAHMSNLHDALIEDINYIQDTRQKKDQRDVCKTRLLLHDKCVPGEYASQQPGAPLDPVDLLQTIVKMYYPDSDGDEFTRRFALEADHVVVGDAMIWAAPQEQVITDRTQMIYFQASPDPVSGKSYNVDDTLQGRAFRLQACILRSRGGGAHYTVYYRDITAQSRWFYYDDARNDGLVKEAPDALNAMSVPSDHGAPVVWIYLRVDEAYTRISTLPSLKQLQTNVPPEATPLFAGILQYPPTHDRTDSATESAYSAVIKGIQDLESIDQDSPEWQPEYHEVVKMLHRYKRLQAQ